MRANPNILEFKNERKPGVGLLLTAMGLAGLIVPNVVTGFEELPVWVPPLFGVVCLVPGLVMLVGLKAHRFDRERGTVTSVWGLLVPFSSSVRSTGDFKTVVICKERQTETRSRRMETESVHGRHRSFNVYPVKLVCEDDPPERNLTDLPGKGDGALETIGKLREHGAQMHQLEKERKASGRASLKIGTPRSHTEALEMAQKIVDFLGVKLCDLGARN